MPPPTERPDELQAPVAESDAEVFGRDTTVESRSLTAADIDILSHRRSRGHRLVRSARGREAVHRLKRAGPALLAFVAVIDLAMGVAGFEQAYPKLGFFDALYDSLGLFAIHIGVPNNPNLLLNISRFLGPVLLGYAGLGVVLALYRDQLNRLRVRRLRNHVVVAGLGAGGLRIARAFSDEDFPVVVIERDQSNVGIESCRERGIFTLIGDATDPQILRQAGAGHAALLVAMCGNDGANIDVAAGSRALSSNRSDGVLTALVEFDDFELWHVMKAQALVDRDQSAFRLELVNVFALAAELLLDEHPPFDEARPGSPHVLVVTAGGLGPSLVVGVLRRWLASMRSAHGSLTVTIVGVDPERILAELTNRNPELGDIGSVELRTWQIDLAATGRISDFPAEVSAIYIALPSDTEALATALTLRQQGALDSDTPIVIAVSDHDAGVARTVTRGGPGLENIASFGWMSQCLRPNALLTHTSTETIARLGHELHCAHQRELGVTVAQDSSLVPWEQLPHALRESNRLWADGIAAKLASVRCVVAPAPLRANEPLFEFSAEEIEALAPLEHDRWSADMKRMGYRYGSQRDNQHHPMIDVPFDELPEDNKEKDREHVKTIPVVLSRAGFTIRRLGGDEVASLSHTKAS
ncbi:MAG TPA: NAD-binding protein [Acidimicrobiales bacterium]|nr:NAD-binding protein [Acidimicrobiales bacterium]